MAVTPGSARSVVVTEAEPGAPAAPTTKQYGGNPGIDSQVVALLQPDGVKSSTDWESGTEDDILLQELPDNIRADAGELMNSYEADDDEDEGEGLVEVDEAKEATSESRCKEGNTSMSVTAFTIAHTTRFREAVP